MSIVNSCEGAFALEDLLLPSLYYLPSGQSPARTLDPISFLEVAYDNRQTRSGGILRNFLAGFWRMRAAVMATPKSISFDGRQSSGPTLNENSMKDTA
jgi:hypothetical protein